MPRRIGLVTILNALNDPKLFAPHFQGAEWDAWRVFLASVFGLPVTGDDLAVYRSQTGRTAPPMEQAREAWAIVGRRGGKSRVAALLALYLAAFRDYGPFLAPGERATIPVIAADRKQARTVMRYLTGLIDASPIIANTVESRTAEAIDFKNAVSVEIHTCSFRSVRGYTLGGAVLDECAFWRTDDGAANPDTEIVAALRPAMATIPGALLIGISSPYARRGILWDAYRRHFGKNADPVLVWQAPTRVMNPTVPEHVIEEAYEEDEASASAEYGGQFRRDLEAFVSREAVDACIVPGRIERPPLQDVSYVAFVDPSGGSADSFTLAVSHREQDRVVLDVVREVRPPFSPDTVVGEYADILKFYGIHAVQADKYAGAWVVEAFARHGIACEQSAKPKSDLYRDLLPLLNSGRVELLDVPRLHAQLLALERRTARGGRDSIDHAPGAHDDVINAAAGALVLACAPPDYSILGGNLADEPVRRSLTAELTYEDEARLREQRMNERLFGFGGGERPL